MHVAGMLGSRATVFCALVVTTLSASCTIDSGNKCRCAESGSSLLLDVGCYFGYPIEFEGTSVDTMYNYRFSPCTEVTCGEQTGAMCQYSFDLDRWFVLGRLSSQTWTVNSQNPLNFTVAYNDGEVGPDMTTPRETKVTFVYSGSSSTKIKFVEEAPQLVYDFQVSGSEVAAVTHYAPCSKSGKGGVEAGVIGWVILSLAIAGLVAYFVIGAIVNYRMKGARGQEIIPNVSFWKELPFLIKDGVVFTFSPCVNRIRGHSGYESL